MHAGTVEKSARLKRVLGVLSDAGRIGVTSRELMRKADVVAPGTCVSELRHRGYQVDCQHLITHADGTRVYLYRLVEKAVP